MKLPVLIIVSILLSACGQQADPQAILDAAEQGDLARLDQLLGRGTVDVRDQCQWTPLMKAALYGHLDVARALISKGADVNALDKGGYSALMLAASNNHAAMVRLLAEHGADINLVEQTNGWTALLWAAKQGHQAAVQSLLSLGADKDIKDRQGLNALDWAVSAGHMETAALLKE